MDGPIDSDLEDEPDEVGEINWRRRSRPRMGAKDRKERKTSLRMMSGEVRRDDIVWGVGDGVDATVCRISPI